MTDTLLQEKRRLQSIIDNNSDDADNGSASAQMQVVSAQADLDRIAQAEFNDLQDRVSLLDFDEHDDIDYGYHDQYDQ